MGRMQPNLISGKLRDHRHPKRMDLTVTDSYCFSLIFYCTFPVRLEQKHTCKAGYCWNEITNNGYALIHGIINTWYVILCSNMTGHWKFGDVIIVYWRIYASLDLNELTHWGRVTHICVSKLTIFGSDNGLAPANWTLQTNFSEIVIEIYTFSFKKMHVKMSFGKWRPSCPELNVLIILMATQCIGPLDTV